MVHCEARGVACYSTSSFSLRVVSRTAVISSTEKLVVCIVTKSVESCPPPWTPMATEEQS